MNLLLVGGGHALLPSLRAAGAWTDRGIAVTLLDAHRYLYYSGMVPEYLGGVYTQDQVRIDLQALCNKVGVTFAADPATSIHPERRIVTTQSGERYSYDVVAFDIGARNPGSTEAAIPTKPLYYVEQLADQMQEVLQGSDDGLRLTIVGGGAAGVEVGLNVLHRFADAERSDALQLTLIEQNERLMADFPEGLSTYAERALTTHSAEIRTQTSVQSIQDRTVKCSGDSSHAADAVLWATGSAGPPLFREARLPTDDQGFLRVLPTLQCPGYPRLFAAGDCATVYGHEHRRKVGVHAVKQGATLRSNLERALKGVASGQLSSTWVLDSFQPYPMAPLILSTGTPEAVWTAGPLWLRGRSFLRLKHGIDRRWIRPYNGAFQTANVTALFDAASASDRSQFPKQGASPSSM